MFTPHPRPDTHVSVTARPHQSPARSSLTEAARRTVRGRNDSGWVRAGLMTLVRPLKLADEIKVATDCLEGAGGTFTAANLIALIQKRASEGLMLPSAAAAKETAAASAVYRHTTQCHQWLGKGTCSRGPTCSWAHDPEFKGRTDLVPTCPRQAAEGKCSINSCYYKHPTPSGSAKSACNPALSL